MAAGPKTTVERDRAEPADEQLPLDPRQWLDRLRAAANPAGLPPDEHEFDQLADILKRDGITADRRAAAYRAMALVPGIIDPASGRYLGERLVLSKTDGSLPAGTVVELTAVTTSVVGEAPDPTVTGTPPVQLGGR